MNWRSGDRRCAPTQLEGGTPAWNQKMDFHSRLLHVANGTSTTMTMEAAGVPGAYTIWADPLHDGPVPGGMSDEELLEVRARHLGPAEAPEHDMRLWRVPLAQHGAYDELVLWFEHDLFDQLNLIQLLTWIRERLPATTPVSLICIGSFPGRPDFKGLGELGPDELAPLLDTRQPVTGEQFDLAARTWEAFREPTPESLDDLRDEDTSSLPYLAAAVTRFVQDYPWTRDGLSLSERRLLTLADGDGIALREAFPRMHDGERVYYVTDVSLSDLVTDLSRAPSPLLTLDLSGAAGRVLRGRVSLTDAGRAVLAGRLDRVETCGLDRWFGGVHLKSGGPVWRWDDTQQRVVLRP
jgi:hypothetical protein